MEVIEKGKTKMLVLNTGEEIVITASKYKNSYVSIYDNGENMVIDSTVNKKNYNIPYQERAKEDMERSIRIAKQKHEAYLRSKELKEQEV